MFLQRAENYFASPNLHQQYQEELAPIIDAAKKGSESALNDLAARFNASLAFGTGGLRGKMGAGIARMNLHNVQRAARALGLIASKNATQSPKTAVIGFDSRHDSYAFAKAAADELAHQGFIVYLDQKPLPTPFLCFVMRRVKASCGIIITASHNPKEDNGFKAYNHFGSQIVSPWDQEIEGEMADFPDILPQLKGQDKDIKPIPAPLYADFRQMCLSVLARPKNFTPAKILYAAFHGTGGAFIPDVFKLAQLPLEICQAQIAPDGNFPTAPRPNPEEIAAFAHPLEEAKKSDFEAILASDPDADRLGVLYKHENEWIALSGNNMAALALDYSVRERGVFGVVCTTVVTSDFLAAVAKLHGLPVLSTLTGFKHIGAAMIALQQNGEQFAFGAEESIGLLPVGEIYDKDAVSAALLVAEMIGFYKAKGQTLSEAISELQQKTGVFLSRLVSFEDGSLEGKTRFLQAMQKLRSEKITHFAGEEIVYVEDYQSGMRTFLSGSTEVLMNRTDSPEKAQKIEPSNVLKLGLKSGAFIAYRPSGTEPKLKIYLQSCTGENALDGMEKAARKILGLSA